LDDTIAPFSAHTAASPLHLHSFPTRRSSDLSSDIKPRFTYSSKYVANGVWYDRDDIRYFVYGVGRTSYIQYKKYFLHIVYGRVWICPLFYGLVFNPSLNRYGYSDIIDVTRAYFWIII